VGGGGGSQERFAYANRKDEKKKNLLNCLEKIGTVLPKHGQQLEAIILIVEKTRQECCNTI